MKKVYICSPYRARNKRELNRNIEYAKSITNKAIKAGLVPITPHLYLPLCLNEDDSKEREMGLRAGIELLITCNYVIAGIRYGISEGMSREIVAADTLGIEVVNADKLQHKVKMDDKTIQKKINKYARTHACNFCPGSRQHTCASFLCREPYEKARKYAETHINSIEVLEYR